MNQAGGLTPSVLRAGAGCTRKKRLLGGGRKIGENQGYAMNHQTGESARIAATPLDTVSSVMVAKEWWGRGNS